MFSPPWDMFDLPDTVSRMKEYIEPGRLSKWVSFFESLRLFGLTITSLQTNILSLAPLYHGSESLQEDALSTIDVQCKCGKAYRLSESLAGKTARCKACGGTFVIPKLSVAVEPPPRSSSAGTSAKPASNRERSPVARQKASQRPGRSEAISVKSDAVDDFCHFGGENALEELRLSIEKYLWGDRKTFQSAALTVSVSDFGGNSHELWISLEVSGTINGQDIAFADEHRIDLIQEKKDAAFATGAAAPIAAFLAASRAKREANSPPKEVSRWVMRRLFPLLKESQWRLEQELYAACGVKDSVYADRWRNVTTASLFVSVIGGLVAGIAGLMSQGASVLVLVPVFFVGAASFFLVHGAALPFMPDSFFLYEPAGRNALKFSGASTPTGARVIAVIVAVVCVAVVVGTLFMAVTLK